MHEALPPPIHRSLAVRIAAWWRGGSFTAVIAMAARASSQLALLGVTLVATRTLAPADFGVFAIAAAFLTLSRTMLYTGPFEYVLKAPEADSATVASAGLVANVIVALGWVLLLCGCGLGAPFVFRGSRVALLLFCLAPSNLLAALAGWGEAMLLRGQQVRRYYAITVITEIAAGLGAAVLLLMGWGLWALVAQVYARLAIFIVAYRAVLVLPRLARPSVQETWRVLAWSWSRYGSVMVGFLANYSGDLLLGAVFSPAASGLYRAGNRVVSALADMFVQPAGLLVTTGLAAERARGGAGDGSWLRLSGLFGALCWPALAGLAVVADEIAPVMLGPAWRGAGPIIAVFCAARMAALPIAVASAVLVIEDRQHRVLWVQSVAAVATAMLTLALASHGPIAAALATTLVALGWALALGVAAWQARAVAGTALGDLARLVLWPTLATLGLAWGARLVALHWHLNPGQTLAVVIPIGLAGWALSLHAVRWPLRAGLAALSDRQA
ncbi:oligosaccharide flippase family protein [Novosphingobium sp. AAP1]|uniref:oligosaccharide flippase family protein n=1 Tax=Novosphingobium sp. AAP1 TaxID=1523413 RepID=UPI000AA98B56|nr:oligosaccharide flippase family protein [Novosphingobium sp. AAP1]